MRWLTRFNRWYEGLCQIHGEPLQIEELMNPFSPGFMEPPTHFHEYCAKCRAEAEAA
jgi:hypothetical protein